MRVCAVFCAVVNRFAWAQAVPNSARSSTTRTASPMAMSWVTERSDALSGPTVPLIDWVPAVTAVAARTTITRIAACPSPVSTESPATSMSWR